MSYHSLDPGEIIKTLELLYFRISERFPNAGLANVCKELGQLARDTDKRVAHIRKPYRFLRLGIVVVMMSGLLAIAYVASIIDYKQDKDNLFGVLQRLEAFINIIVLMGAAVFFLSTAEARWKRQIIIGHLHEIRMIVHVIDMHQLTKDPGASLKRLSRTPSSPDRTLSPFELVRYLDYCSEMYALAAKVALLYAQSSRDSVIMSALTEIEHITANLSAKVWQKITIIEGIYSADTDTAKLKTLTQQ